MGSTYTGTDTYLRESADSNNIFKGSVKNLSVVATIPRCLTKRCDDCTGYYANRIVRYGLKCNCKCHKNVENRSEDSFYLNPKSSEPFDSHPELTRAIKIVNQDTKPVFRSGLDLFLEQGGQI